MGIEIFTTSSINNLVSTYKTNETTKRIDPLTKKRNSYNNLSSVWSALSGKLGALRSSLLELSKTGTSSIFNSSKTFNLSASQYFDVIVNSVADTSSYRIRVDQLAKNDLLMSNTLTSADNFSIAEAGRHRILVQSGDYKAYVDVNFEDGETNESAMKKINSAINNDKAAISSAAKEQTQFVGSGSSSFKINVGGITKTIEVEDVNKSYSELIDELISKISSQFSGVKAEKIIDGDNVSLKITVNDAKKALTISHNDGFDLVSDLNISAENEKGASAIVNSSYFVPINGKSKLTFSSVDTGYSNRIIISDVAESSALASIGLTESILTNRTIASDENSAGFKYLSNSETDNELNAKINFNGINIQRDQNNISDIAYGVTLNLIAEMKTEDPDVVLDVKLDVSAIKNKISDFITKFNDVFSFVKNNSKTDALGRGVLAGNASASGLLSALTQNAYSPVQGLLETELNTLSKIGVSFNSTLGLTITDESKLTEALNNRLEELEEMFNRQESGIANRMLTVVKQYVGDKGVINNLTSAYQNNISYLNKKITSLQKSIDNSANSLRNRYYKLQQQLVSLLNASGNYATDLF